MKIIVANNIRVLVLQAYCIKCILYSVPFMLYNSQTRDDSYVLASQTVLCSVDEKRHIL